MWIGDRFNDGLFPFPDGTSWNVGEKISEKKFLDQEGKDRDYGIALVEAQAVYHCQQTEGPSVDKEGIMKVRMKVPPSSSKIYTYDERYDLAIHEPAMMTQQEIATLRLLNERNCSCAPQLYTSFLAGQTDDMPVPGGYIVVLVMEKLPGVPLSDFYERSNEQKRTIREAFKSALIEVFSHGVVLWDIRPPNILYDEENDKCYLIDYEQAEIIDEKECYGQWADWEWPMWGLRNDRRQ